MAIRIAPVLRPHFPRLASRYPHPPAPTADRQEGSHDHHPLCATRSDHDEVLQILGGKSVGVLLRRHVGPTIVFGLHQELYERKRDRYRIEQFPQRGAFLRWLVYGLSSTFLSFV